MEIPIWVSSSVAYFTAVTVLVLFLKNLMTERKKQQHQQERVEQGSLANWWSASKSQIVNWRRTLGLLGDALETTANLAARIGVVVVLVLALYLGVSLPFAVPFAILLPGLIFGVVGAGVVLAIVHKLTEPPPPPPATNPSPSPESPLSH